MTDARPATTILILRDAPGVGLQVFLVQRNRTAGFLPNAWVFPGGRVDPTDALDDHPQVTGGAAVEARWEVPAAAARAHLVAGVRETFEESGIWLGPVAPPAGSRAALASGALDFDRLLRETGAQVDLDRLRPWSWWVTPVVEKRRFDTRFLLAVAETDVEGSADGQETVASGWFDPKAVVRDATLQDFPLAPPTWWTLVELAAFDSAAAAMDASQRRPERPIRPIMHFTEQGMRLVLPGHPEHDAPAIPGLPEEVRFERGRWVAGPAR
jgi:8-oxo-dGTP pyrophosphatase MutT (NUDIX family)